VFVSDGKIKHEALIEDDFIRNRIMIDVSLLKDWKVEQTSHRKTGRHKKATQQGGFKSVMMAAIRPAP